MKIKQVCAFTAAILAITTAFLCSPIAKASPAISGQYGAGASSQGPTASGPAKPGDTSGTNSGPGNKRPHHHKGKRPSIVVGATTTKPDNGPAGGH